MQRGRECKAEPKVLRTTSREAEVNARSEHLLSVVLASEIDACWVVGWVVGASSKRD